MGLSFQEPVNRNYAAVVTTVHAINKLDNCDNVVGIPVFGYQAIVSKDTKIGDKVVVFVAETQLSEEFVRMNNLFRDASLNVDPERKGYIEQNRRVRAIKFRGHRSDAFALSLESLAYTGINVDKLEDNDTFDFLNGQEICRKYEVPKKSLNRSELKQARAFRRVDKKFMPEHYDTDNWMRNSHTIADEELVIVTQKLHGCFTAHTRISMADGTQKKIKDIIPGEYVLGYSDGVVIPSKVINSACTGKTDSWIKLKFNNPRRGDKFRTVSTHDHKFFTSNRGYVRADELNSDDTVLSSFKEEEVTPFKRSIIVGKLLGDSSISKRERETSRWPLNWFHKSEHKGYMEYIAASLGNLVDAPMTIKISGYGTEMLSQRTVRNYQVAQIAKDFFTSNNERCIPDSLEFDAISLSIWYMDDGSLAHHEGQEDRANFAICRYDAESCENLVNALKRFGFKTPKVYTDTSGYNRLRLNKDDAEILYSTIREFVPEVMQYKLPDKHRGYFKGIDVHDSFVNITIPTTLIHSETVSSEKIGYSSKYDIETETNNFFAQKVLVHNSSIRMGHVPVARQLTWKDKLAKFFGIPVIETEYDIVYGSRRVIKDVNNPNQDHFYDKDIWTEQGKKYDYALPHNYIIYGELVGFVEGNTPIMTNYTYNVPEGQCNLYVYRVAIVTHGGRLIDLSWDAVKDFCRENGLNHTPEFARMTKRELVESGFVEALMDVRYTECGMTFTEAPIPLSDPKTVDEGICLRVERGVVPHIFKAKSPKFLEHETKLLDADVVDLEAVGSESTDEA